MPGGNGGLHSAATSFVKALEFKRRLRVCNAYFAACGPSAQPNVRVICVEISIVTSSEISDILAPAWHFCNQIRIILR